MELCVLYQSVCWKYADVYVHMYVLMADTSREYVHMHY